MGLGCGLKTGRERHVSILIVLSCISSSAGKWLLLHSCLSAVTDQHRTKRNWCDTLPTFYTGLLSQYVSGAAASSSLLGRGQRHLPGAGFWRWDPVFQHLLGWKPGEAPPIRMPARTIDSRDFLCQKFPSEENRRLGKVDILFVVYLDVWKEMGQLCVSIETHWTQTNWHQYWFIFLFKPLE